MCAEGEKLMTNRRECIRKNRNEIFETKKVSLERCGSCSFEENQWKGTVVVQLYFWNFEWKNLFIQSKNCSFSWQSVHYLSRLLSSVFLSNFYSLWFDYCGNLLMRLSICFPTKWFLQISVSNKTFWKHWFYVSVKQLRYKHLWSTTVEIVSPFYF